jgi:ribosomal protein L11 methyltransferase
MKSYFEISITANERQRELLIPTLLELGCQGFQETESHLIGFLEKQDWSDDKFERLQIELRKILQTISVNAAIQFREVAEENWNEQWEKTIQPIEIGAKLVIKPSWCSHVNKDNRIIIQIDPKMSFGTGYHETTRLTLRLLEKHLTANSSVLDVGTGTGVLSIAAVKLGAKSAVGIDIDEWSIENAKENVAANSVAKNIVISSTPLHLLSSSSFDLITANLTLNTNIELLDQFYSRLFSKGLLLLSGLLQTDRDAMVNKLREHSFDVIEEITENEWTAIAARKK